MNLAADCSRCVGLCCVAPAFVASSDFAFSKPAGVACRHLAADASCSIHERLIPSGFPGCVAYDCFGAGQRVVALFGGSARSAAMLSAYEVVRQLHELLWYMTDALSRAAAAPVHGALADARSEIDASIAGGPSSIGSTDPEAHRAAVAPLLRRASSLTRRRAADLANRDPTGRDPTGDLPGRDSPCRDLAGRDLPGRDLAGRDLAARDLAGRDLAGRDLARADLSTSLLIGADLRGADLRSADLLGADLRGANLAGADLTGALYLTRTQVGSARGSSSTRLPDRLSHPPHWLTSGSSSA